MKASAGSQRVLMLLENNPYPQDTRVRNEATALTKAGYRVSVICPADPGQPWRETVEEVAVYRFPSPPVMTSSAGYLVEYGYALIAMLVLSLLVAARRGFDVIHAHNPPDVLVLIALLHRPFGKQFIFDHHDLSPEMYDARFQDGSSTAVRRALLFFERLSFRFADHVIATNQSYREVALTRGKKRPEEVSIVRNGPNLDRVFLVEPDPELRRRAGTILGYVGRMGTQDGVDYFIRALRHLVDDLGRKDVYAVIIGRGDAVDGLKALARQLGLEDYVWFTGTVTDEELRRYLSTADICVDPDPSSPFNDRSTMIKMMEYMTLGKPIVAFDLPEHRYTAGDAAVYVTPNDERRFAEAIAELMDDEERRRRMGASGRERVEQHLVWERSIPALLHAYSTLLPARAVSRSAESK